MTRIFSALLAAVFTLSVLSASTAGAQSPDDVVWVQIEAQPQLRPRRRPASRAYADQRRGCERVLAGAGAGTAIAVGPYTRRADAEQRAAPAIVREPHRCRAMTAILPAVLEHFRQQFWPVGANVLNTGADGRLAPGAVDIVTAPAETATPETPEPEHGRTHHCCCARSPRSRNPRTRPPRQARRSPSAA